LLSLFKKKQIPYLIVDFSPNIYKKLAAEGHPVIFGDITDEEIIRAANIKKAKMVISTINSLKDNLEILEYINSLKTKPVSIFTSMTRSDALKLYEHKASYVVVPDIVAGEHLRQLLRYHGFAGQKLKKIGRSHFKRLIFV